MNTATHVVANLLLLRHGAPRNHVPVACGALLTTGTGMLITVANGTYVLVGLMLTVVLAGLLSALWARQSG